LDGSAQPWVHHICEAGIRPAFREGKPDTMIRKFSYRPVTPLTVYDDGGSFISLYPKGIEHKITVGVERDPPCIGVQWVTLEAQHFLPPYTTFVTHMAPARSWIECQAYVDRMQEAGYLRGMSASNTMIGNGDSWLGGVPCLSCASSQRPKYMLTIIICGPYIRLIV
jgi:UDP-3-O-acyl-N-acetylglucosamine deacetylase